MVLLALVEQATAKKDRSKRPQCHAAAFDYCTLANLLEPGNPQTLNMLANHHFHTWRSVEFTAGAGCVVDEQHLMLPAQAAPRARGAAQPAASETRRNELCVHHRCRYLDDGGGR
jgi:hypothetical protein